MYPVLFEIPGLGWPLRSFGVLVAVGFLLGLHIWRKLLERHGEDPKGDPERANAAALAILIGVIAGGRLMYVIVEISKYLALDEPTGREIGAQYLADPFKIFAVWEGGLVMYGGFLGAIALGLLSARKHGLNPLNALDTALIGGFVGQVVGRIGCLAVGDDYGSVVPAGSEGLPFPLTITVPSLDWLRANPESLFEHDLAGKTLWATQVWMSINALIIVFTGIWLLKRRRYFGQVALWILLHYSVTRLAIEFFRGDSVRGLWLGGTLSTSQLISIPAALIAILLLIRFRNRRDPRIPSPA